MTGGKAMKLIRWVMCKTEIRHRVMELWQPLDGSGLSEFSAALYGSTVEKGQVNYFECVDCATIIAPFEVVQRGWKPVAGNLRSLR